MGRIRRDRSKGEGPGSERGRTACRGLSAAEARPAMLDGGVEARREAVSGHRRARGSEWGRTGAWAMVRSPGQAAQPVEAKALREHVRAPRSGAWRTGEAGPRRTRRGLAVSVAKARPTMPDEGRGAWRESLVRGKAGNVDPGRKDPSKVDPDDSQRSKSVSGDAR